MMYLPVLYHQLVDTASTISYHTVEMKDRGLFSFLPPPEDSRPRHCPRSADLSEPQPHNSDLSPKGNRTQKMLVLQDGASH